MSLCSEMKMKRIVALLHKLGFHCSPIIFNVYTQFHKIVEIRINNYLHINFPVLVLELN